jgi:hypothetical protein
MDMEAAQAQIDKFKEDVLPETLKGLGIGAVVGALAFTIKAYTATPAEKRSNMALPVVDADKVRHVRARTDYMDLIGHAAPYAKCAPKLFAEFLRALDYVLLLHNMAFDEDEKMDLILRHKTQRWGMHATTLADEFFKKIATYLTNRPLEEKTTNALSVSQWRTYGSQMHNKIYKTVKVTLNQIDLRLS